MSEPRIQYSIQDYPFTCPECKKEFRSHVTEQDILDGVLLSEYSLCSECLEKKVDLSKLPGIQ